jgi:hypothetical protein
MSLCAYLEGNALIIYLKIKYFERNLRRSMKHAFYIQ